MRNQLMSLALSILALTIAAPAAHAQTAPRPSVALLDFDFGSIQPWWSGNIDLGKQVSDLLVDELVNDGTFRVIERKRLDVLMNEQSFSNSERADPGAAALVKLGKSLGVKYLIVGSVTRFGLENSSRSFGTSFGVGVLRVGNVNRTEGKGTVAITARIIDVETGEILASAKGEGMSKRKGVQLEARPGGAPAATINLASTDFQVTVMGEATEAAIKSTAAKLVAARARLD